MKRNILLTTIFLILLSCSDNRNMVRISGVLKNGAGEMIYLKELTSMEMIPHDSTLIDPAGYFELRGRATGMKFFAVHTQPGNFIYLLAGERDDLALKGDAMNLSYTYEVEGSEQSGLIRKLTREQNRALSQIQNLSKVFNDSIHSPNFMEIKSRLDSTYEDIVNSQREFTFQFIEQNLHSLASLMALYQQIRLRYYLLDPEEDFKYFALVDSSLSILYPESDAVRDLPVRY